MPTDRNLSIRLSVEEADRVKKALEDLGAAAKRLKSDVEGSTSGTSGGGLAGQVQGLKGELEGLTAGAAKVAGVAAGIFAAVGAFNAAKAAIAAAGDEVRSTTAKINLATESLTGGSQGFAEVARIAQTVGAPLEATASLFARIGRSAADAGATTVAQVSKATETVQKLGIASGASTQEASAAALQLGQALASGRLQGDELRSILENMPALGRAIAKEFGVGVGALRDLGAAGELVSDRVLKAILDTAGDADRQFAAMPKTVERATQEMSTAWTLLLAKLDQTLGVSKGIVAAIERARGLVDGASAFVAPDPSKRLESAKEKLGAFDAQTAAAKPIVESRFDREETARERSKILSEILALENQISAEAISADQDDARRFADQKARMAEKIKAFEASVERQKTAAKDYYAFDEKSVKAKDAYDKASADAFSKLVGVQESERKRLADLAGKAAVYEMAQKDAMEDRAKSAKEAEQERIRQAKDSERAAKDEEDARRKGLETVDDQIDKLNEEAKAIGISERARAIANETLKAEIALRKAGVAADQDMLNYELQRVADAAGSNFDAKAAAKERDKLAAEAQRAAEREAEASERPFRNLFDNLQRGAAEMFDAWMSGTAKFGDTVVKVIRRAAAEFVSASVITPFFQDIATQFGIGGSKYDANAKGSTSKGSGLGLPSFGGGGGGGFLDSITNRIDALGSSWFGTTAPGAAGGWAVAGTGGPTAAALDAGTAFSSAGTLSSYLPYVGAGVGVLTNLASGNVAGAGLTAAGAALGSIIPGVGTAVGAAVGGVLGSFLGGKKPSVGPGGGIGFGANADGTANIGWGVGDNGYKAEDANRAAADAVAGSVKKIIEQLGGTLRGSVVEGRGAELGWDAGLKMYTGGDNTAGGAGRFKTIEEAMAASVAALVKNADFTGLSKDLSDRVRAVASSADLDALLNYVDGLKKVTDAFVNWKEPLTATEQAMQQLDAAYATAKAAAESLSQSTDKVTASYQQQKDYLIKQFVDPLDERFARTQGRNLDADLMAYDRQAADLLKQAAALGPEALAKAERVTIAERLQIQLKYAEQSKAAEQTAQEARYSVVRQTYDSLVQELKSLGNVWRGIADSMAKFGESLKLSELSVLSPEDKMIEAQRQYRETLAKALGGDQNAAGALQGAATTALEQTRSYYSSGEGYARFFAEVQGDIGDTAKYAADQADAADQALGYQKATAEATRTMATIMAEMKAASDALKNGGASAAAAAGGATGDLSQLSTAAGVIGYGGVDARGFRGDAAGLSTDQNIQNAYQQYWGRSAADWEVKAWTDLIAQGQTTGGGAVSSIMYAPQAQEAANLRGFETGGETMAGELVKVHRGELLYTGPKTQVFNSATADRMMGAASNDNGSLIEVMREVSAKLDVVIRATASSGDANVASLGELASALDELVRRQRAAA